MRITIIILIFSSCTWFKNLDLRQEYYFGCKSTFLDSTKHIDSVVLYALTSSDGVLDLKGGSYNPMYIKGKGKRYVNKDSIGLRSIDSIVFTNVEFNAYSQYSFPLTTEYAELGDGSGFYHVYEIYFKDSTSNFVTQIATVHGAYLFIGFSKYGTCNEFIQRFKKMNARYIKF